jgi:hypothetical protein
LRNVPFLLWSSLQKLQYCTILNNREKLSSTIEVGEFYLGGQRSGKRGKGTELIYITNGSGSF